LRRWFGLDGTVGSSAAATICPGSTLCAVRSSSFEPRKSIELLSRSISELRTPRSGEVAGSAASFFCS
jgi:hypothetical protein